MSKGYQIYQHILDGIKDGLFAEGDQVPKEIELASQFNISRATVARALRKLKEEGIIERRKGLGTYVERVVVDRTWKKYELKCRLHNEITKIYVGFKVYQGTVWADDASFVEVVK